MSKSVTFVIPAYNEQEGIENAVERCIDFFDRRRIDGRLVVVDDGSDDETPLALERARERHSDRVGVVTHERNLGMGAALESGYLAAETDYLSHLPADMQVGPEDAAVLLDHASPETLAMHVYARRGDGALRGLLSAAMRSLLYLKTGVWFRYAGTYVFHRSMISTEEIRALRSRTFVLNFEILAVLIERAREVRTFPIVPAPRTAGTSKVLRPGKLLEVLLETLRL
ncbi:MAG: glycosyltransferase family 2 protein [Polyangia bacterium]